MKRLFSLLSVAALLVSAVGEANAGTLYGSSSGGVLFTINTVTGVGTLVGNMPFSATEIEYDNTTGRTWAQQSNGAFTINEFAIGTAAGIGGLIGDGHAFNGLEYVGSTLYGAEIDSGGGGAPAELRTLDPTTGISELIGPSGTGPIAGLAYDTTSGIMYGIRGGPGPADLLTISLTTGAVTVVRSIGIQAGSLQFGMDGNLYAGGTGGTDGDDLFRISTATGASTLVGATGFAEVTGLTLVTGVPEPSSLALLAMGGLTLVGFGWRRKRTQRTAA